MPLRNLGCPPSRSIRVKRSRRHLERDPCLQARKLRSEAVVDAAREREMGTVRAADIEPVGLVERLRVQARNLLRIADAPRIPRVVLVGDAKQLDAVDAGKPFAQLQAVGMKTAVMDQIMRRDAGFPSDPCARL